MVNPKWPHPTANNTLAQYWGDGPNVVADLCTHYLRLTKKVLPSLCKGSCQRINVGLRHRKPGYKTAFMELLVL